MLAAIFGKGTFQEFFVRTFIRAQTPETEAQQMTHFPKSLRDSGKELKPETGVAIYIYRVLSSILDILSLYGTEYI